MPQFYNITGYRPGDTFPSRFGELQTFWLDVEGVDGTVRVNKQVGKTPPVGQVYGTLEARTNKKGGTYYQFKQERAPEGVSVPSSPTPSTSSASGTPDWFAPYKKRIEDLEAKLNSSDSKGIAGSNTTKEELEDIFGGDINPQDL